MADPFANTGFDPTFGDPLRKFLAAAQAQGIGAHVISGVRDDEDQRQLQANHIATVNGQPLPYPARGPVPAAAAPGQSAHEYGLAADVQADSPADQARLIRLGTSMGLAHPMSYDPTHFEAPGWRSVAANQPAPTPWSETNPANVPTAYASNVDASAAPAAAAINAAAPSTPGTTLNTTPAIAGVNPNARGMRNNNPGNLVANNWTASLPGYKGSDGRFAIFDTPANGAAALDRNLQSYGSQGINTPLAVANRWAPASDNNNPTSYGGQIAKGLGVAPNAQINLMDPSIRARIAQSIAMVENGPGKGSIPGVTGAIDPSIAAHQSTTPSYTAPTDWLAKLTTPSADGKQSPLQQAIGGAGKAMDAYGQAEQQPQANQQQQLQAQQAAAGMGMQRQQQVAAQAQQLMATLAQGQRPLSWGSAPPGSTPGGGAGQAPQVDPQAMAAQMMAMGRVPGTTLNSIGDGYGLG